MSKAGIPLVSPIVSSVGTQFGQDFGHGPLNALFNLATGGVPGATHAVAGDYGPTARQGAIDAGLIAATIASAGALGGAAGAGSGVADTTAAGADAAAAADTSALATSGGALSDSAIAGGATQGAISGADAAGAAGGGGALSDAAIAGGATTGATSGLDTAAVAPAAVAPATTTAATPSLLSRIMTSLGISSPQAGTTPLTMQDVAASNLGGGTLSDSAITGGATTGATSGLDVAPGAAAAAPGAGGGGLLDTINAFTKAHPLLTAGGSLAASQILSPLLQKLTGSGMTSQEKALLAAQQPAINAEGQLIQSETTGVLPPGAEASVQQALESDIANIKSRYAAMGMSGSSAEAQDIANAQASAAAQKFSISAQATQTGLQAAGITSDVYNTLIQDQLSRQAELQNAFSGFFNAVGLGTALAGSKAA